MRGETEGLVFDILVGPQDNLLFAGRDGVRMKKVEEYKTGITLEAERRMLLSIL